MSAATERDHAERVFELVRSLRDVADELQRLAPELAAPAPTAPGFCAYGHGAPG